MQPQTNIPEPVDAFDPFNSASNPSLPAFELWGMVEVNAYACALVKGLGKVRFNPSVHDKRFTAIDLFVQPLAETNVTNPKSCERHPIAESKEWASITWNSIKSLGTENLREVNDKWARVAVVPNGKTYENKDGEKKDETCFKFLAFFDNEDACRSAYLTNGGHAAPAPTEQPAPVSQDDTDRQTAMAFLNVIVPNAARGKASVADAQAAVSVALTGYPTVAKFFTADSDEVTALILKTLTPAA